MSNVRPRPNLLATGPLTAVCAGLLLAVIPLMNRVEPWATALLVGALGLRLAVNRFGVRLPPLPLKIMLLGGGIGGIAASYGTITGIEPGLGILLVLISLKLLETNSLRDFQVLILLGWFLCLCCLFFSQDLAMWLYVGALALFQTVALISFHRSPESKGIVPSLRLALVMTAQAVPIAILLFIFFPRAYGGFRFQFSRSIVGTTGMSDRVSPGSFSNLALSDQVAFRADFPDGKVPLLSQLYWRGAVLWRGDELTWVRGVQMQPEPRTGQLDGPVVRQRIVLQPHGGRWLFALDRPAGDVKNATFEAGGFLQSAKPIVSPFRYEIISRPENREQALLPEQQEAALEKPQHIAPEVQALVDEWRAQTRAPREIVELALHFFRREHFVYTVNPGTYGDNALAEFLFHRRRGFCEHYAAAFASLMRIAGVPSRVVIGYQGGTFNRVGNYVIVRQLDAHAWSEVWIAGTGWMRVDPTSIIAPDRITSGSESYMETSSDPTGAATSSTGRGFRELLRDVNHLWDNINYQWDLRILNYDEETQTSFLTSLGFANFSSPDLLVWIVVVSLIVLGGLGWWLRRPPSRGEDAATRIYHAFCRRLESAGLSRESWEGPMTFGERAAAKFPPQAAAIQEITKLYILLRYGSPQAPMDLVRKLRERLRALPKLTRYS